MPARTRTQIIRQFPTANPPSGVANGESWVTLTGAAYRLIMRRFTGVDRYVSFQKDTSQFLLPQLVSAGDTTPGSRGDVTTFDYADAVTNYSIWELMIDERYIDAGTVTPMLIWMPDALQSGTKACRWTMKYTSLIATDVAPASSELTQTTDVTLTASEAAYTNNRSNLTAVAAAHFNANHHLTIRIEREGAHANDTMTGAAKLIRPVLILGA